MVYGGEKGEGRGLLASMTKKTNFSGLCGCGVRRIERRKGKQMETEAEEEPPTGGAVCTTAAFTSPAHVEPASTGSSSNATLLSVLDSRQNSLTLSLQLPLLLFLLPSAWPRLPVLLVVAGSAAARRDWFSTNRPPITNRLHSAALINQRLPFKTQTIGGG